MPEQPYLTKKRDEFFQLVTGLREEVAKIESSEELDPLFEAWKKDVWRTLIEPSLKESFRNGQAGKAAPAKRDFAWRKPKEE